MIESRFDKINANNSIFVSYYLSVFRTFVIIKTVIIAVSTTSFYLFHSPHLWLLFFSFFLLFIFFHAFIRTKLFSFYPINNEINVRFSVSDYSSTHITNHFLLPHLRLQLHPHNNISMTNSIEHQPVNYLFFFKSCWFFHELSSFKTSTFPGKDDSIQRTAIHDSYQTNS